MNFANYCRINSMKYKDKLCLIERDPESNTRRTLRWVEFNREVNRVANYLKDELGVMKGDRVMHLLNNSIEWVIIYFGIIKIGAITVPLNFRFVEEDIHYAAEIAKPVAFFLGEKFLKRVSPVMSGLKDIKHYIFIGQGCPDGMVSYRDVERHPDTEEALIDMKDQENLTLMFTSGTTGNAKPVMHTHGSMNAVAIGNGMSVPLGVNDNYLIILPLYHSGSFFLWSPYFAIGATGTIITRYRDPKDMLEAIDNERACGVLLVVPMCVDLINRVKGGKINLDNYDLSSWIYLTTGAQPVPQNVVETLMELLPCQVIHTYGVTEGGGGVTWTIYHEEILKKPLSIGRPNFCVEGKIVDEKGRKVPVGEVGEIIIKSPRLMKEYFGDPDLTEKSMKNGYFHTGDLAKMDDDGFYYIVDRKKDVIISGGENIYPVEIEEALFSHPHIIDAAVIAYPDPRFVEIALAVVQLKEDSSMTEEEVIEYCKTKLAMYKVPRKVVFGDIPRNPTGKIMKPLLRERYSGKSDAFSL